MTCRHRQALDKLLNALIFNVTVSCLDLLTTFKRLRQLNMDFKYGTVKQNSRFVIFISVKFKCLSINQPSGGPQLMEIFRELRPPDYTPVFLPGQYRQNWHDKKLANSF